MAAAERQLTELEAFGLHVAGLHDAAALARAGRRSSSAPAIPNADLMFVGEAPGFHEDKQG